MYSKRCRTLKKQTGCKKLAAVAGFMFEFIGSDCPSFDNGELIFFLVLKYVVDPIQQLSRYPRDGLVGLHPAAKLIVALLKALSSLAAHHADSISVFLNRLLPLKVIIPLRSFSPLACLLGISPT
jgi:hypothetical protein